MKTRAGFGLAEIIIIVLVIAMFAAFAIAFFVTNNKLLPEGQRFSKPCSKVIF